MMNNKSNLFIVAYNWYEDYSPKIVKSPKSMTDAAFDKLCRSLLNDSTNMAIKEAKKIHSCVGFHEIIDALIELLQNNGFKVLNLHSFGLWGTCIINKKNDFKNIRGFSKDYKEKVLAYNIAIQEKHNIIK